jgi:hypothetical protein
MSYTLSGAVNLTRYKGGSFKEAAKEVLKEWGFEKPEKILVNEHRLENDIMADNGDSILEAVVKRCIELAQRRRYHCGIHALRQPRAQRPKPPSVPLEPPKQDEKQLGLF